jgi:glycoprotein endo-alpha-1,2-mannosidase
MKTKSSQLLAAFSLVIVLCISSCAMDKKSADTSEKEANTFVKHTMSPGLIMAGYQGWFNAPEDGANRGWYHLTKDGRFEPGSCTIDMWPEMTEYEVQHETTFQYSDGSFAKIFSSNDESTVRLHFKWMKDYGIDGVFMQRFVAEVKSESGLKHFNKVLKSASKAAMEYDRTIAVMYDMSGMNSQDADVIINDWKKVKDEFGFDKRSEYSNYLFCEGRPLVAIWGVGFNDNREYNLDDIEKIIKFLKSDEGGNCSVMLGVPTWWRKQKIDCVKDEKLHELIKMADAVHPWLVGRFNEKRYDLVKPVIGKDKVWTDEHDLKYMPVVFPGFSWYNMYSDKNSNIIDRNNGHFFWKQLKGATSQGAEMIYVAMFDEIDEATAIFKIARKVPVGDSKFVTLGDDIPSDHYLWLTGQAGQLMKDKKPLPQEKPFQNAN